ncbi:MAG: DotU family type IV/VI secretion system protein [Holosporaceae bacterium]|jgi:type VI secretion system protein ImpK|nr:DotU family type IV/VI secretion system protein [Holosporaceae bacterium]
MQNVSAIKKESSSDLAEIFGAFCLKVFDSKKSVEEDPNEINHKDLHKSISSFLKTSLEDEGKLSSIPGMKEVIYVMAAVADEIFLSMEWAGKKYWEENMLEQLYFESQIAGEEIFNRINKLMLDKQNIAVEIAGIYLRVLSLGFKGKYRGSDNEQADIDAYRNKLFEFIEKNDKSIFLVGHRLFQKEYTYTIPTIHRKLLPDTAIINYICAFFIFMFLVIGSVVWIFETRDIRQLLADISNIALQE